MNKCLVLFVEGDTDKEFYKCLIKNIRRKYNNCLNINIEYVNVKGVGGFKNIAIRKFNKEIKPKYKNKYGRKCKFCVALCRDTDVFELSPRPPLIWEDVEKAFKDNGAEEVIHIQAIHSIEDWFLYDANGVFSFLELPQGTKVIGSNGLDKIQRLFKKANKVYYKGMKVSGFIEKLDIDLIENNINDQLDSLYKELGINQIKNN